MTASHTLDTIIHPLDPVFDSNSRVLVLGTMPSPASREVGFYYGHPQNRFWKVLAMLLDEPLPLTTDERIAFAIRHHIALWDVLKSCEISGASDASIRNPLPNDLSPIIGTSHIDTVFTTGAKAALLYRKFDEKRYPSVTHIALPSTSAANAKMSLHDLVLAFQPLAIALQ